MRHLLLDIEGTTTSISFVYDVLFPYAVEHLPTFIKKKWKDPSIAAACRALILTDAEASELRLPPQEAAIAILRRQMAGDVKAKGLKSLQGLVWQEAYETGAVQGHLYPDVPVALAKWKAAKVPVAIYSSGSILAQKLLFRHSIAGDLTALLAGHFDTTIGPKREAASYRAIAAAWKIEPKDILFATDQPAEAEAAHAAGCTAVILMRPGNAPLPAHLPFAIHADFAAL